jgi:hypothetical protein
MSYVSPFTGDVIQPTDVSYRGVTLTANTQLNWPSNSTTATDYAARIMDVSASTAGLSLFMPPANQASVGNDALIRNVGAQSFTVKTFGGNGTIVTIPAGQAQYIYITDNPDVYGTWGIIAFGIGSSGADAAALAGLGLVAISTTLNQSHPTSTITNGYTYLAADRSQAKIWTSGSGTSTLPLASTLGNNWFTLFKNNGTGTMTIGTTAGEFIDGATTKTFQPNQSAFIVCTGTEYVTVGYGAQTTFAFTSLVKPVVSGTYVLTTSEAQNVIQEYVGTLTGNVTAVYPQVVTLYIISNQTVDNGYTLTIKTSAAGAGSVIIPPGQQATLVCDGVNFFNANTVQAGATSLNLVNGTVGTPAINFALETDSGMYRPGTGQVAFSILGSQIINILATGITVTGEGKFSGGIKGGTFS